MPATKLKGKQVEQFTSTAEGVVPLSGGGTSNFLRADGTWSAPPSGGTSTLIEVEVDFGTQPVNNKTFTIIDGSVVNTNKIIFTPSPNTATGQQGNDWEVDSATFSAKANIGSITLYVNSPFVISGKRKLYYQILN